MKLQICNKIFLDTGHVPPPLRREQERERWLVGLEEVVEELNTKKVVFKLHVVLHDVHYYIYPLCVLMFYAL